MLSQIYVKDLVIVSTLDLPFQPRMTALTGETGAGKSILIDALGLTLGDKADPAMIRNGCERAEVSAEFDLEQQADARRWLEEQGLDDEGGCILRRQLVAEGRSRAFINGRPVPMQQLQELGAMLVDIHGQHAHQSLMRAGAQRELLDDYAGIGDKVEKLSRTFKDYKAAKARLQKLREAARDRQSRLELLSFQKEELEELNLSLEELKELDEEQRRLHNVGRLQETAGKLIHTLYDGGGAIQDSLFHAVTELDDLLQFASELEEARGLIDGAAIQVQEAASGLRAFAERLELDPARLDEVEQRLSLIHDIGRKYRLEPELLPQRLEDIIAELAELEQADSNLAKLDDEVEALKADYLQQAAKLSELRAKAGRRLAKTVTDSMQTLGMGGGRFLLDIAALEEDKAAAHGLDAVEFLVSANPGQSPAPLAKVASGGELSRISLAIQVATAECGHVPTLIFDEVDVGIGGGVAEIVGQLLRRLGEERQVLCVTHLPQVAAQAHHHLQVSKTAGRGKTTTGISVLSEDGRVEEVARMLGGVEITERTLEHAREMLHRASA